MSQRLAGQSFPNGVLIRSDKTWALATDDGNLHFGSVTSWLDHHKVLKTVFIRSIVGLIESIAFSIRIQRVSGRDTSREFVRPLVYYLAVMVPIGLLVDRPGAGPSWPLHVGMQILSFVIAFTFFTRALPGAIWSYHGAEHKAVHAHEQNVDLNDLDAVAACSRVHNRCGTNLVTFLATASMLRIPSGPPLIAMTGTIVYTLFSIGIAIEIFRLVTRTTHLALSRLLLAPGRAMQRYVTTREPDRAQLAMAVRAVQAVLAADGMKTTQEVRSA
ncbi:MAG: DUF1385 domain-containing protein [Actinomycetota bacterium]|nr:DUF1385 domain-containing protein [Actinomycetota bacterium]